MFLASIKTESTGFKILKKYEALPLTNEESGTSVIVALRSKKSTTFVY
jgi:hypothetical protein